MISKFFIKYIISHSVLNTIYDIQYFKAAKYLQYQNLEKPCYSFRQCAENEKDRSQRENSPETKNMSAPRWTATEVKSPNYLY